MCDIVIDEFVTEQKHQIATDGIVICGSYAQGRYGPDSDIDILFLTQEERSVNAQHIIFRGVKFHRLLAGFTQLWRFLLSATEDPVAIAVPHSLSAQVQVIEDAAALRELLRRTRELVIQRGIEYNPQDRDAIILNQKRYRITKVAGHWKLASTNQDH